ncbi:centrosomal protein of 55 kDa-like isoform X1 [Tachysurus fulvidraco]|uniref:centrosomal protein of 55 kDa-like isoform X1 n=1 Tax=Tachysurus fulvidraco TaxID=1234273 RepID=UPI000F4D516C|nr:centrosomal protein of 55 kDa-like isoform X1 [Tachysurus fulvidraco]XP_047672359.1 centrosomal protein of 55 kDa-like isoform X1 [Tachysurus fulvidraco]
MASKLSRNSRSYSEGDINKRREENTSLRKTPDEVSDHKGAPSVFQENHVYLERILSLETLREKNSQQILARDQEIAYLWQMLRSETVTSLHTQIIQLRAEAEIRETLYHSLKQETEEVKKKVEAVLQQTSKVIEKNEQWLMYDQQREAYVKVVLAERCQLEQELHQFKNALLQKEIKVDTEGEERELEIQQCYEKLVDELEREQQKGQQLLTEHHQIRKELVEERLKSAELQQQIHLSAKDLQDVNHENQHLQLQLHRVLKKLKKALEKVVILESEKERETSSSVSKAYADLERVPKESPPSFSSSPGSLNLLDKSFLECPVCRAKYPTNGHRELLVHIDHCFGSD